MRCVTCKILVWFAAVSALGGGAGAGHLKEHHDHRHHHNSNHHHNPHQNHENINNNNNNNLAEMWTSFMKQSEKLLQMQMGGGGGGENDAADKRSSLLESESDRKLHDLRVQHVQNQILQKLRLKERPRPARRARFSLPLPVKEGATMLQAPYPAYHPDQDPHTDDFYGKTDQKVVFPDEADEDDELGQCGEFGRSHPTACFRFTMPGDLQPQDVSSTELWMYKEADPQDIHNQTLLVSEATHWDFTHQFRKTNPIAIYETDLHEGWIKIDVGWDADSWPESPVVALEISCPSCGAPPSMSPISLLLNHRPFLVFNTKFNTKKRRVRHLECSPGVAECCRERLYVSFAELGWDDWILQPRGYHAHFCRGSCDSVAAVTISGSYHQTVLKKLFHSGHPRRLELRPCCTPTTFSSLQLFYMDSNNTVTQKTLPNMIVESCGCM